jgi:hypothetical protein
MAAPASTCCDGAFCSRHDPRKVRENHRGRYRRRGLKTPQILMLSLGLGYLTISMY